MVNCMENKKIYMESEFKKKSLLVLEKTMLFKLK